MNEIIAATLKLAGEINGLPSAQHKKYIPELKNRFARSLFLVCAKFVTDMDESNEVAHDVGNTLFSNNMAAFDAADDKTAFVNGILGEVDFIAPDMVDTLPIHYKEAFVKLGAEIELGSKGRIKLELKPTQIKFSSSEVSSDEEEHEFDQVSIKTVASIISPLVKHANYMIEQGSITNTEQEFIDTITELTSDLPRNAKLMKFGYEIPGNYGEFKSMLAKVIEPFDEEFADNVRIGKGDVGNAIFKSWSELEYLVNSDTRDPRIIITEYSDSIKDAVAKAATAFNKVNNDSKIQPDMADGIVKSFIEPFQSGGG